MKGGGQGRLTGSDDVEEGAGELCGERARGGGGEIGERIVVGLSGGIATARCERGGKVEDIGHAPVAGVCEFGEPAGLRGVGEVQAHETIADLLDAVVLLGDEEKKGGGDIVDCWSEEGVSERGGVCRNGANGGLADGEVDGGGNTERVTPAVGVGGGVAGEVCGEAESLVVERLKLIGSQGKGVVIEREGGLIELIPEGGSIVVDGEDDIAGAGELVGDCG